MPVRKHVQQAVAGSANVLSGLRFPRPRHALAYLLSGALSFSIANAQEEPALYVSPEDPVNEYLDAIDLIEADYGPYALELSDLYLGLGPVGIFLGLQLPEPPRRQHHAFRGGLGEEIGGQKGEGKEEGKTLFHGSMVL